jgi:acetylornithine deacetylase/succinyl-diaminopimelate desuccinylase family protein
LIRARSDYPPGDTRAVIAVVAEKLASVGIESSIIARREPQVSLIAELSGTTTGPTLLFHAHADTVAAGDAGAWARDAFGGQVVDGNIYGRGAGDDKGSLAAQVMAVVMLARAGVRPNGRLQLAAVADEESGGLYGTRWLRDSGQLRPDYLVVGEQTGNQVAIAERVACGIDLTVFGKSAHGATPWEGENAIMQAAQALSWLQTRLYPRLAQRTHPFLPPPSLNVGRISGGVQWNIVPDQCTVAMDRRLIPGETREQAMAEISAVLEEYSTHAGALRYELSSEGDVAANINTSPAHPFARAAAAALQAVCGERRDLTGYVQTSDGRWFAGDGIPIILFGPGDPALAHAANEYISTDQLIEATRFLTLFGYRWLNKE